MRQIDRLIGSRLADSADGTPLLQFLEQWRAGCVESEHPDNYDKLVLAKAAEKLETADSSRAEQAAEKSIQPSFVNLRG